MGGVVSLMGTSPQTREQQAPQDWRPGDNVFAAFARHQAWRAQEPGGVRLAPLRPAAADLRPDPSQVPPGTRRVPWLSRAEFDTRWGDRSRERWRAAGAVLDRAGVPSTRTDVDEHMAAVCAVLSTRQEPGPRAVGATQRFAGRLKVWFPRRRHGYVTSPRGDLFLHISQLRTDIDPTQIPEGTDLTFTIGQDTSGRPQARDCEIADGGRSARAGGSRKTAQGGKGDPRAVSRSPSQDALEERRPEVSPSARVKLHPGSRQNLHHFLCKAEPIVSNRSSPLAFPLQSRTIVSNRAFPLQSRTNSQ
eukprot:gene209-biopygen10735